MTAMDFSGQSRLGDEAPSPGPAHGPDPRLEAGGFTGGAELSFPLSLAEARGLAPELSLTFSTGAGNGPFGLGLGLGLGRFAIRTGLGVPEYLGEDPLEFAGAGPLTPSTMPGPGDAEGRVYLPQFESEFPLLIQRKHDDGTSSWKVVDGQNQVSLYGVTGLGRVADPLAPARIAEWQIEETRDSRGNWIRYRYKADDRANLPDEIYELGRGPPAQRYVERIAWGNYTDDAGVEQAAYELVFDYGEYALDDLDKPGSDPYAPVRAWPARADAWSTFRPGFDLRTQRLCRNILLFHRFGPPGQTPQLVRSWQLLHAPGPIFATVDSLTEIGWRRRTDGSYERLAFAATTFEHSRFDPPAAPDYRKLVVESRGSDFPGIAGQSTLQPIDLDGVGLPGLLSSEGPAVVYRQPLGAGLYAAPEPLPDFPSLGSPQPPVIELADLDSDGRFALVAATGQLNGYFARAAGRWLAYRPFPGFPTAPPGIASTQAALSGTGYSDALLLGADVAVLFAGRGTAGYAGPRSTALPADFPTAESGGEAEILTFADPFGDGLAHRVRVRDGSFEVWPSLGHGRFGPRIQLANAPRWSSKVQAERIFLTPLSGSGGVDMVVAGEDFIDVYVNQAGNSFAAPRRIALPDPLADVAQLSFADILGTGGTSILFTRLQPATAHFFYPLAGSAPPGCDPAPRPWMLVRWDTQRGSSTSLSYASSTSYYLSAEREGRPWLTKVPFAAEVVATVCTHDEVNQIRSWQTFDYADGYYDRDWREFRGFAYVSCREREEYLDSPGEAEAPSTLTRRWYLVGDAYEGAALIEQARGRYFPDPGAPNLAGAVLDPRIEALGPPAIEQAWRALAGRLVREELYSDADGGPAAVPLTATASCWSARLEQPAGEESEASIFVHEHQSLTLDYGQVADDPSTLQHFVLEVDAYGAIRRTCSVHYPRRPTLDPDRIIYPEQTELRAIVELSRVSAETQPARLLGLEFETRGLSIGGLEPPGTGYFSWTEISGLVATALSNIIPYGAPFDPGELQARPYNWRRTYYWDEAQLLPLPLGKASPRALIHHRAAAAFSDRWLAETFADKVDAAMLRDEAGYAPDGEGYWWNPGTVTHYARPDGPHLYFLPRRTRYEPPPDAHPVEGLLAETEVEYDAPFHLFETVRRERIDEQVWLPSFTTTDYQSLRPALTVDANGNCRQYLYDPLGRLLASSTFKPAEGEQPREGDGDLDDPADFERRPGASFTDVLARKAHYLQQATDFHYYDGLAFVERGQPCSHIILVRQTHVSDLPDGVESAILAQVDYADARGQPVQSRRQVAEEEAVGELGWLVEAAMRFNSAGLAVERFNPWYAPSPLFVAGDAPEGAPVPPKRDRYDPLHRLVRSDDPRGFFTRTSYTPWQTTSWDRDDTVCDSEYYQAFMRDYPPDPTVAQRDEWEALTQAAGFYNTPRIDVFDNAGGQIRVLHNNLGNVPPDAFAAIVEGSEVTSQMLWDELHLQNYLATRETIPVGTWVTGKFRPYFSGFELQLAPLFEPFAAPVTEMLKANGLTTCLRTDIQKRRFVATDPRLYYANVVNGGDHANFRYSYMMQQTVPARSIGVDPGTRWTLADIYGCTLRLWDAGRVTIKAYDRFQRLLRTEVETGAVRIRTEEVIWGESAADAARCNLWGEIHVYRDEVGIATSEAYSLQGQIAAATRQLTADYRVAPDWAGPVAMQDALYRSTFSFDVQERPVAEAYANGAGAQWRYDLSGRLQQTRLSGSDGAWIHVTDAIGWSPASQIARLAFAGGVEQERVFDPATQRIMSWRSSAAAAKGGRRELQSLDYVYDPVGNVTLVRDRSAGLLFCYEQAEAVDRRCYDALYQLMGASGREHPGIGPDTHVDGFKQSIFAPLCPADPDKQVTLRAYEERYRYDDARNLVALTHLAAGGDTDFERLQPVDAGSNRLAGQAYDESGNPLELDLGGPVPLGWDARNLMVRAGPYSRTGAGTRRDYFGYDHSGMRVRHVVELYDAEGALVGVQERINLGNWLVALTGDGGEAPTVRATRIRLVGAQQLIAILDERGEGEAAERRLRLQLADIQNSVAVETGAAGEPLSFEAYYPFGGTSVIAGPDEAIVEPKHIRYSGKPADDGLGLYNYGARYFASWTGRWLNPDPGGTVNGLNLFQFTLDDPTTLVDSDGREARVKRTPGRNGNLPTVRIHVEGVLVNNSAVPYTPQQMRGFARRLERQIARSYSGVGPNVRYTGSARIRASNRIGRRDHVFRLAPVGRLPTFQQGGAARYLPGNYRGPGVVGYAPRRNLGGGLREGQRVVFIRTNIANNVPATAGAHAGTGRTVLGQASLERTGAHEFGHTLGLDHPVGMAGNLMQQTGQLTAGLQISEAQILNVEGEYNAGRLNGNDQGMDPQLLPF